MKWGAPQPSWGVCRAAPGVAAGVLPGEGERRPGAAVRRFGRFSCLWWPHPADWGREGG